MHVQPRYFVSIITVVCAFVSIAQAAPVSYTLDSSQSILSVSGVISALSAQMTEQASGSLSTTYSGTIQADLGGGTIELLGGTLTAANSGSWQPDTDSLPGNDPANYGGLFDLGFATLFGAVRGFSLETVGPSSAVVGGQFTAPSIHVLSGVIDYLLIGLGTGSGEQAFDTINYANTAGPASLSSNGSIETLSIPVNAHTTVLASEVPLDLDIIGTLVATRPVPEPATGLFLIAGSLIALRRRRAPRSN